MHKNTSPYPTSYLTPMSRLEALGVRFIEGDGSSPGDGASGGAKEPEKAPVAFTPEQQAEIDRLFKDRLERDRKSTAEKAEKEKAAATKTLEDRLAELEKSASEQVAAAKETALNAQLERLVANTHSPELVAKLIRQANPDLDGSDPVALAATAKSFVETNAWVSKTEEKGGGPDTRQTPGGGSSASSAGLMTEDELRAVKPEQLAADPELFKRFKEAREALAKSE